ncbi:MAG: GNAT family N-acetyltransferase [Nitrosopumilus sp.]|uniref:glucosamine-phosphate N-acetyltransferase n=1 Tax=Nitrosopumilus zosterae TaxID=718286 RepID=A0A2S2KPU5_9ARCH|nr:MULTISPECIES: GNAT family N-acetyltransferase [Nitrosopumilus]MCV0367159.1 GNAT family N-acetyltransferase [Nitrosopumilus sp.]BDQ31359.1 GNAT family N-acetyltransferase [Nitrosopumilus zosterae]GBH33567.1 acetyltransferase [Nitrosopumilus zosterae]
MSQPIIRELRKEDILNGFLTTLDALRKASDIRTDKAMKIFEKINSNPDHIIAVAELDGKIVGTTTLLIEQKFIHDGGVVGHIEDVVVNKDYHGQKIGEKIMKYVLEIAKNRGCYKTILDCTDDVKPFYEKLGFKEIANELRFDHV